MKKVIMSLSMATCLFFAQGAFADAAGGMYMNNSAAQNQPNMMMSNDNMMVPNNNMTPNNNMMMPNNNAMMPNNNMNGSTDPNTGVVYAETCPASWEKPCGNGYVQCCCYKPSYYTTCNCEQVPQYSYKKCCRYVPEQYQVTRCRYVPQYYQETCCRNVPQYYTTCQCKYCPKYTYQKHCCYVPQYSYRCECPPVCDPCCQ